MPDRAEGQVQTAKFTDVLDSNLTWGAGIGLSFCVAGYFAEDMVWKSGWLALGVAVLFACATVFVLGGPVRWPTNQRLRNSLAPVYDRDPAPVFATDASGRVVYRNPIGADRFGLEQGQDPAPRLEEFLANPRAALFALQRRASVHGHAAEDILTRRRHYRLSVNAMARGGILWRFETLPDRSKVSSPTDPAKPDTPAADSTTVGVNSLPVPLMIIDASGRVVDANSRARTLMDRPVEKGTFASDVFEGLGRSVTDWLNDAQIGRLVGRPEVLKVNHSRKEIFLQVSVAPMDDRSGSAENNGALLAVLNDATELKTLEAQFVQSQKMQAIGQLAGGVAHDFNNLLTAISGHCDLLLLRHDQGDPEYSDLVQIHQNANRAASLVGQLLAFSRKQNLQPEVLDLRDTLSDLTHLLNRLVGEKVRLRLSYDPDLGTIRADKRQLEQVLMNLVVNARDAMPEGGEIHIATSTVVLDAELTRSRATVPPGEYIVVSVTDEGIGIPADKLPKIFEPFYTTKQLGEGTGLGLSTAYGIVKQTGGFIFADSEPARGTTFSLYFPVHLPLDTPEIAMTQAAPPVVHAGEGVVLLVEDEAPVRAFASRALKMRGFEVLEAENAEEALDILKDDDLDVDVFVTDVIMPGLDGPTWVREALKTRPDTKVIFVSGYAEESLTDSQQRIPNSIFLPKPFSLNELTATVMQQT